MRKLTDEEKSLVKMLQEEEEFQLAEELMLRLESEEELKGERLRKAKEDWRRFVKEVLGKEG